MQPTKNFLPPESVFGEKGNTDHETRSGCSDIVTQCLHASPLSHNLSLQLRLGKIW